METAKYNIRKVVKEYELANPQEYADFVEQMKAVRATMVDEKFGLTTDAHFGDASAHKRLLYEMPETLHAMLVKNLTDDQLTWLKSGAPEDKLQGGRWFATAFPAYRVPRVV